MAVYQPNDGNYSFQWANYLPRSWASAAGADLDADGNAMGSPPARTNPGHRGDCEAAEAVLPDGVGGADVDAYAVAGADADADADADLGGSGAADDGDGNSVVAMLVSLLQQLLRCVVNETISGEGKLWGKDNYGNLLTWMVTSRLFQSAWSQPFARRSMWMWRSWTRR